MPSSRKQKNTSIVKPSSSYVHPSLEPRSSNTPAIAGTSKSASTSVSERIEFLRRAQAPRATSATLEALSRPPTTSESPRRRFAGPPPPRSWLEGDASGTRTFKYGSSSSNVSARRPGKLDYFPGLRYAPKKSLLHQSMMSMAVDFDWHLEYDHTYLAQLPVELKRMLLSYIAYHGPANGLTMPGLRTLFFVEDGSVSTEAAANDELDRLDLGGSIGRGVHLKDLGKFWRHKMKEIQHAQALDSWELIPSLTSDLRFPALTKLSLAHPGPSVTWSDLVTFSRNLGSLTHLSLAYWPAPRLSSSIEASPGTTIPMSGNSEVFDLSEAAYLLRMLSRNTPSLQYLSLEGCAAWSRALRYDAPPSTSRRRYGRHAGFDLTSEVPTTDDGIAGAEWTASWRNITHLDLSQGWIPLDVDPSFLFQLHNSRGKYDVSFSMPRIPATVIPAPPPSLLLQSRVFPAPRMSVASTLASQPVTPQESYTITAPSSIADSVQAASRRRKWCQQELDALLVENWVRMLRKTAGAKVCTVEHGWDAHDLMEVGYAEQDLFAAGF